jgi:cation transport ATPase
MDHTPESEAQEYDLTMHVFTVSAGMVGVCLTAIGLLRLITAQTKVQTLGDDLLAVDAILFVICVFLAFWSFKTKTTSTRRRLRLVVDILFLVGLAGMAAICAVIAYAIF